MVSQPSEAELMADEYDGSVSVAEWKSEKLRQSEMRKRRVRWCRASVRFAAAAGIAMISVVITLNHHYKGELRSGDDTKVYATGSSERRSVTLPDGSRVTLAPHTELVTHYTTNRRDIVLEHGEAWFSILEDRTRPCIVFAGSGAIRVLGTQFDVRRERDASDIEQVTVTVSTGAVEVGPPTQERNVDSGLAVGHPVSVRWQPAKLVSGQELTFDAAGHRGAVAPADLRATEAWREGRLEFRHAPLRQVILQVNEYSKKPISLDESNDALGDISFSGTVFEQRVPGWLHALQAAYPVDVTEDANSIKIRARRHLHQ